MMKPILTPTLIVSMALMPLAPLPAQAQVLDDVGRILAADGTVLCEPTPEVPCDITNEDIIIAAQEIEARLAQEAAAAAEAEAAAAAEAAAQQAAEEAAAAEAAAAEAAALAEAEAAAAAEAAAQQAAGEAAAAEAAAAEAAALAEAEAATAAEAAAQKAAEEAAAAEAAAAEAAAAEAAALAEKEAAAAAEAAAQKAAEEAAAAEAAATEAAAQKATEEAAAAEAEAQQAADEAAAEVQGEVPAPEDVEIDPAAVLVVADPQMEEPAAPVEAPTVSEGESQALIDLLAPTTADAAEPDVPQVAASVEPPPAPPAAVAGDPAAAEAALLAIPAPADTVATTVQTITTQTARTSTQEFSAPPQNLGDGKKSGLSDLEKVGLFVLGALVIGQVIKSAQDKPEEAQTVVSNTGDRVVVLNPDGSYGLFKDDDAILRQAGSTVRTETYGDGSSRTIVQRQDGTQVVTVRDATGRVLRRAQYDSLGRELVLLDDFAPEIPVNVADLPRPRVTPSTRANDAALRAAIAARQIAMLGRGYSLRQIREIAPLRALAAEVGVDNVTFAPGSAAITPEQANALADLGAVMQDMLAKNPAEMFLIEGHTDATGAAPMNLALSDRRAESVALALSEYFAIPPENMVVQGYGETELRINTPLAEPQNRRVAVRIITPLLAAAQ